ncbi:MAG TPA: PTS sugar transporter subunit IIA [Smithellaceae bacterium]|jgi:PTS system nitrogen regulatory IIA component|nr:PTS sugar transporter subunit IIA [Smithellaceae bacterium]HNQ18007.1 PTS sugar transporter subunit IIA [Smithellaceae bacterium]HNT90671.1 PTS sugar transporter subunit IIA [Smithellaceae bacterium]HNV63783.1 PTS sugar transporter subunit IIA [Smithellaceae bacterium]HOD30092.1 PTS sugar transporter subunit IIA [Smithellaceae bacterium]
MRLDQILNSGFINESLQAKNKTEVLQELVQTIIDGGLKLDSSVAMEVLQQREKLGSTGIGDGVAIPHGKIPVLEDLVVAFGRSKEGISFDAIDGKPVHLFFLLLAPENSAGQHLKALAKISKMLKVVDFRKKLMDAKSSEDLYKIIISQDQTCQL